MITIPRKFHIPGNATASYQALIMAAFAQGVSEIENITASEKTHTLLKALSQLGIITQFDEDTATCIISGCAGRLPKRPINVWCGDSKQITYYLLMIAAAMSGIYYFDGASSLRHHKVHQALDLLNQLKVQFLPQQIHTLPFTLISTQKLVGETFSFEEPTHSHLITGLLMMAPFAQQAMHIILPTSMPHAAIDFTCHLMSHFGILVQRPQPEEINITPQQLYQAKTYSIPPDFQSILLSCTLVALSGQTSTLQNINKNMLKPTEIKMLEFFKHAGCDINIDAHECRIKSPEQITSMGIHFHEWGIIASMLALLAPFANAASDFSAGNINTSLCCKNTIEILAQLKIPYHLDHQHLIIQPHISTVSEVDAKHNAQLTQWFNILKLRLPQLKIKHPHRFIESGKSSIWSQLFAKPEAVV